MTCGFTGTSRGMAPRQLKAVRQLLYPINVLHLGDCIGADRQAYLICQETGTKTIGHPPDNPHKRVFLEYDEIRTPKPYLKRNIDIVREGVDGLVATPPNWVETPGRGVGAGTWSTVRRARELGRKIWIVLPDGSVVKENQ